MYCASCGALIDDASRFCPHCGMPTSQVVPNEADYAGLTIDAETGRQLGDTSYASEPTRMLYDVPPATAAPAYDAAPTTAIPDGGTPTTVAPRFEATSTTVMPGSGVPAESYTPSPAAYAPAESYTPTPSYAPSSTPASNPYQAGRQRNSNTMTIAISAAIGLVALLVIVLHLSGVAPWVQGPQAPEPTGAQTVAEAAETSEPEGTGTTETQPAEPPQAEPEASQSGQSQPETYIMPDSDTHRYTTSELAQYDLYQLYLARNEIYARHGRQFRNQDLQDYFNAQSWYHGTIAPDDFSDEAMLNEVERANTATMLQYEKDHNSPYL